MTVTHNSNEEIIGRAEINDIVNAQRIVEKVLPADVVISGL